MKLRSLCLLLFLLVLQHAYADTRLIKDLDVWDVHTGDYNASHWIEQGGLRPGLKMYGEADITITAFPRQLIGADWIQTAYGSGACRQDTMALFRLAGDAEVFIAYAAGEGNLPAWLSGYRKTKEQLTNSAGKVFTLFSAIFHKEDKVLLGGNRAGDSLMYLVIVKPLGKMPPLIKAGGKVFDVNTYGAKGDGQTVNTHALQSAIDACTDAGGGSVYLHDGVFVTGTLELKDNVTLFVAAGSILRGSADPGDYTPKRCDLPSYRGKEDYQLIYAERKHNIGITGGGIIDGFSHGKEWPWRNEKEQRVINRPRLIRMVECRQISISQISLIRSAYWTQYYEACDSLSIDRERVRCYTGQDNQDGIDISGCKQVELQHYYAITGDDAVCIKTMSASQCKDLYLHDLLIRHANCHAVKIGTETHSDVRNVRVQHVIADARYGTAIESVDGSMVENILYEDILLTGCGVPIFIRLGQRGRTYEGGPIPAPASSMRHITIRNLRNTGIGFVEARDGPGVGSSISGVPGSPIEDLTIESCHLLFYGSRLDTSLVHRNIPEQVKNYPEFNILGLGPAYGLYTRHVKNFIYRNLDIRCLKEDVRPAIVLDDVSGYTLSALRCDSFPGTSPALVWNRQDQKAIDPAQLSAEGKDGKKEGTPRKKLADWPEGFHVDSVTSSKDGAWQKIYVYQSAASTPQPLIISLHSWSGNYTQQDSLADETKKKDWNYIHPDFRGENKRPEAGGSDLAISDLDDAIEWATRNFKVDPKRIYLVGVSGGGYATLCAYGRLKHEITSFTAWVPISDLQAWYYQSLTLTPKYAKNILAVTGSTPDHLNMPEIIKRSPLLCPVPAKRLANVPLTILAGVHDGHGKNSVPVTQSMLYYNKLLRDKGVKDSTAYIPEKDMNTMLTEQRFPAKTKDYIGGRLIHYQKKYENIRLVIFEGGHEILFPVGAIF